MSFKIGDNVILISTGPNHQELSFLVGRAFIVESNLIPTEDGKELLHHIGPAPRVVPGGIRAVPQYLIKIDPPGNMRGADDHTDQPIFDETC